MGIERSWVRICSYLHTSICLLVSTNLIHQTKDKEKRENIKMVVTLATIFSHVDSVWGWLSAVVVDKSKLWVGWWWLLGSVLYRSDFGVPCWKILRACSHSPPCRTNKRWPITGSQPISVLCARYSRTKRSSARIVLSLPFFIFFRKPYQLRR